MERVCYLQSVRQHPVIGPFDTGPTCPTQPSGSRRATPPVVIGTTRRRSRHVQRRFRQQRRTGRPNAGKSTNTTLRYPLDHTPPPQASQTGRALRERITTSNGPLTARVDDPD